METNEQIQLETTESGLVYEPRLVGGVSLKAFKIDPTSFFKEGFRMATLPEVVEIAYDYMKKGKSETLKEFGGLQIYGNSVLFKYKDGMFTKENPATDRNGHMYLERSYANNPRDIETSNSTEDEKKALRENTRNLKFVDYDFPTGILTPDQIKGNKGLVALLGNEQNLEKLAQICRTTGKNLDFEIDKPGLDFDFTFYSSQGFTFGLDEIMLKPAIFGNTFAVKENK